MQNLGTASSLIDQIHLGFEIDCLGSMDVLIKKEIDGEYKTIGGIKAPAVRMIDGEIVLTGQGSILTGKPRIQTGDKLKLLAGLGHYIQIECEVSLASLHFRSDGQSFYGSIYLTDY